MSTRGVTLAEQGFIHCSLLHQVRRIADLVYPDTADLVILVIDTDRLAAQYVTKRPSRAASSSRIYGPVSASAVTETVPVSRDAAGQLILPPWLASA